MVRQAINPESPSTPLIRRVNTNNISRAGKPSSRFINNTVRESVRRQLFPADSAPTPASVQPIDWSQKLPAQAAKVEDTAQANYPLTPASPTKLSCRLAGMSL